MCLSKRKRSGKFVMVCNLAYQVNKETRVLHLITRFKKGGAEQTTENTLEALTNRQNGNYKLYLGFGSTYSEERVEKVEEMGVETVPFQMIRHYNPFTQLFAVFSVALFLKRNKIQVIHTHSTEAGIIGRVAGFIAGTPVIIHEVHGDPIAEDRNSILNHFIIFMERVVSQFTTCIIVKSENIKKSYISRGIGREKQFELIYHGIDIDLYQEAQAVDNITVEDEVTLLYVGRLEDGKGLYDLLSVFQKLESNSRTKIKLLIAGDGSIRDNLVEKIKSENISSIEVLGYRNDIPQLMKASDIFVLPSYREGTPRVITEALAAGIPVISTDIAGIPEQVNDGETGKLITPGDTSELYSAMESLVSNPEYRRKMVIEDKSKLDKFRIDKAKSRYVELYNRLSTERYGPEN